MTFGEFLTRTHAFDNPKGDFVRDARRDRVLMALPLLSAGALDRYLRQREACVEARDAARLVWRAYQRRLRREASV